MADSEKKDAEGGQDKTKSETSSEEGKDKAKDLDNLTPEEIEKALKEAGYWKGVEKLLESKVDQRVTQAVKTTEERLKKEREDAERKAKEDEAQKQKAEKEAEMSEAEKKISALEEQLTKATSMFNEFMGKQKSEQLNTIKAEALKKAELPASWTKRILSDTPEDIKKEVEELQKDFREIRQEEIDKRLEDQKRPFQSTGTPESSIEADIDKYLADQETPLTGAAAEQLKKSELNV